MDAYSLLFLDSFKSMFALSLSSETAWFAARDFGAFSIVNVTAVCFSGAVLGAFCSIALGWLLSMLKDRLFTVDEVLYSEIRVKMTKYGIYIFLFQMLPFIKIFFFFTGMFRISLPRMIAVTLAGRVLFYVYYLYIYPLIPSF